jgi:glutamate dehydrogenase/leucine dehydrogenase
MGAVHDPRGLDVDRLLARAESAGHRVVECCETAERLPRAALLELPVDVLSPCARHETLHAGNASAVKARWILPGANNPVSAAAEEVLVGRGVVSLPDFLCNCGGVLGGTMAFASIPPSRIEPFIEDNVQALTEKLLERSAREGVAIRALAEGLTHERIASAGAAPGGVRATLFDLALEGYRRGWLPGWLSAAMSPWYFRRLLQPWRDARSVPEWPQAP